MTMELLLPLLLNVVIGAYFVWFYPRSLRRNFRDQPLPRGFAILQKAVPIFGAALIIASVIYGVLVAAGVVLH